MFVCEAADRAFGGVAGGALRDRGLVSRRPLPRRALAQLQQVRGWHQGEVHLHTRRTNLLWKAHGVRGMTIGELADQLEHKAKEQKAWPGQLWLALLRARKHRRVMIFGTQNDQSAPKLADVVRVVASMRR